MISQMRSSMISAVIVAVDLIGIPSRFHTHTSRNVLNLFMYLLYGNCIAVTKCS